MICPACRARMSTPIVGRRTRKLISHCTNAACGFTRVENAQTEPVVTIFQPNHGAMFVRQATETVALRQGAFERFDRATVRREVWTRHQRDLRRANAVDGKRRASGGDR